MFRLETIKDSLKLALPAVGEMVLYMMIWVFDTMMVGKYGGNTAVSTVGLSSEIMYTAVNIFIMYGISVGIASLVARSIGSDQTGHAEEYATLGLAVGSLISLALFLILFFLSKNILMLAGAEDIVVRQGVMFIRIASVGIFFYMIMSILNGMLRGYGNTHIPLLASVLVNIINLGLDWLLIFGHYGFPELGIKGAAIATCSAQTFGFIFIAIYVCRISKIKPRIRYLINFNTEKLKLLLKLSLPSTLQEGSIDLSRLIGAFIVMHLGTLSFAANQITITVESVSFMPGWGFAIAATTLVGMRVGEKNMAKAREYAFTCTALGVVVMTFCSLLFLIFPHFLIGLFIDSSETQVIYLGAMCLMIAALEQPFLAVSMILGGALKGSGDTRTPFLVSLVSCWGIRIPLMVLLIYFLKMSVIYVWWITALQWIFEAVVLLILFNRSLKKYAIANENEQ